MNYKELSCILAERVKELNEMLVKGTEVNKFNTSPHQLYLYCVDNVVPVIINEAIKIINIGYNTKN